MTHSPFTPAILFLFLALSPFPARAADLWVRANDPSVISTNDCGAITSISGTARIRRSFQKEDERGMDANIADRVNSGDELVTDDGGRLEMVSGSNTVLVVGGNSRVRVLALRSFTGPDGKPVARLDVQVIGGMARAQVRLNEESPALIMASLADMETLVSRGDVALLSREGWRIAVLKGEALARTRRGQVTGTPFPIPERRFVGANGEADLGEDMEKAVRAQLPFSFEVTTVALPPMPSVRPEFEAP